MLELLPESIGRALIHQRAGMQNVVYNLLYQVRKAARMELRSTEFAFNARIPVRFTADGDGISPPLKWEQIPAEADSLALIVEDADAPTPHPLVHAIVVDLKAEDGELEEGALNSDHHRGAGLETGRNSFFKHAWLPPDPPPGHGEHRYVFQIFALREGPLLSQFCGRSEFIDAVLARAIGVGCVIGTYERDPKDIEDAEDAEVLFETSAVAAV